MIKTMIKVLTTNGYIWVKESAPTNAVKKRISKRRKVSQLTGVITAK